MRRLVPVISSYSNVQNYFCLVKIWLIWYSHLKKFFPQTESLRKQPNPSCDVLLRSVSLSLIKVHLNLRLLCHPMSVALSHILSFILSISNSLYVTLDNCVSDQCPNCECLSPYHFYTFLLVTLHQSWPSRTSLPLMNRTQQDSCVQSLLLLNSINIFLAAVCEEIWYRSFFFSFLGRVSVCGYGEVGWLCLDLAVGGIWLMQWFVWLQGRPSLRDSAVCITAPLAWCLVAFFFFPVGILSQLFLWQRHEITCNHAARGGRERGQKIQM